MNNKLMTAAMLAFSFSTTAMAAGDVAAGKAKSAICAACHGANGISTIPMYPNLAGQKATYTAKQLRDFKSKTRKDPVMAGMVAALTETDIVNIAAYYESLK
ncbi:MAG: c-type cytochrome [Kangiellaceae bacterium]